MHTGTVAIQLFHLLGVQFIMLLKGKLEQVSFLHVYHHGSISAIW